MDSTISTKPLPFSVNRATATALSAQIVHGVTAAMRSGYYGPGERLPSITEMASVLDVGSQTVRKALGELSERGDVVARPRSGIRVADRHKGWFTRHLVHLRIGCPGFYFSAREDRLETLLMEARVRTTGVMMTDMEVAKGLPHLRLVLDSQPVDLVFLDGVQERVAPELERRRIPYMVAGARKSAEFRYCVGQIHIDFGPGIRAMAAHLQATGCRHIAAIGSDERTRGFCLAATQALGIRCDYRQIPDPASSAGALEIYQERAGYERVRAMIAAPEPLPDALVFFDDYLARGGYTALLESGKLAPRDVQLISQVNVGHLPVFGPQPTRIEVDPCRDAEVTAEMILATLRGDSREHATTVPQFVVGETTRSVPAID